MASDYVYRTPRLRPLNTTALGTLTTPARSGAEVLPSPRMAQTQTGTSLSHATPMPAHVEDPAMSREVAPAVPPAPTPAPTREAGGKDNATGKTLVAAPHGATMAPLPRDRTRDGYVIQRCDGLRTLVINDALIHFTPTEYRLLIPMLDQESRPVPFKELTRSVLNRELDRDARRLLDKHIDHIRSKLRPVGLNIHCVARYGYMLLPEE